VFSITCENGHLDVAKWLYEIKPDIDISVYYEFAFKNSCKNGHLDVAKWLYEIKPDIDISCIDINDIYNHQIIKWLDSLNKGLTYKIIDGEYKLYKQIKTIKKDNIVFTDNCCVCLEQSNCLTECYHNACLDCINQLKKYICPMCRKEFKFCYVKN